MTKGKTGFVETGEVVEAWHITEAKMLWLVAAEAVTSGDVLVLDTAADAQAASTTTEANPTPVVVVAKDDPEATVSLGAGESGWFQAWGRCAVVNLMSAATRGNWLVTSTTSLKARPMGDVLPPPGAFGYAITAGSTPEAFLFGVGGAAKPAAYIVDSTGGDYTSVVAAANALGSTAGAIFVRAGTYTETNTITLGGNNQAIVGEKGAIIYGNHALALLSATGKSGLLLSGITFKDKVDKGVDNSVIDLNGCTDFRIVDCDIRETYFRGIDLAGCDRGIIRGCTSASARAVSPGAETSIYLDDCEHIEITENIGYDQGYTAAGGGICFIRLGDCNYCGVTDNRQDVEIASRGIQLYHSHHNTVANNFLQNNTWLGIGVGYASHFNSIIGNTCHNNSFENIEFGEANIGNIIANNICTAATSTVYGRGIFMEAQGEEGQATTLDGAISNIATGATVADGTQLPSANMLLRIGEEYIYFASRSGNGLSGGVRAEAATVAASHATAATVTVLGPRDNIIEGNVCNWNKCIGIGLHHAYNCTIADNICINNGYNLGSSHSGLYLDNLTDCLVTGNRMADTRATPLMWHGVCFSGINTNVRVLNNYVTGAATSAYDIPDAGSTVTFVKMDGEDWVLEPSAGVTITTGTGSIILDADYVVQFAKAGVGRAWIGTDMTLVNTPLNLDAGYAVDFDRVSPNQIYAKSVGNALILTDRTAGSHSLSELVTARDESRPHKVEMMEYEYIAANTWATVCHITDQGNMTHLWLALDPVVTPAAGSAAWAYPLTIAVDGVAEVDTIVGNFFASTLGAPRWSVDQVGCSYMNLDEGTASYYRYVSVPFDTSLTVKVHNITNVTLTVWGQVGWHDGLGSYGDRSQEFHCVTATASVDQYLAHIIGAASPVKTGRIAGFMLAVDGGSNWGYLEGNIDIEIDGTKTIEYSGTEDAFLGSFYYTGVKWQNNHAGMTKQHTRTDNTNYYQSCFYRFFDIDQVPFEKSFQIQWHNGEVAHGATPGTVDAWSEVWYYTE